MTNIESIFLFAEKHNFPKTECEVIFGIHDDGSVRDIHTTDANIIGVKFDKTLVENEINIEDIRFDVISNFPDDVFFMWQKDDPKMSLKRWIAMGKYIPNIIKNTEYFDELESLTKEIEMKLETAFSNLMEVGDSDFDDEDYDEDSDFDDDDDEEYEDGEE